MLKIFRQYMKYVLPVAACALMLVFVLEGSLDKLFGGGDPGKQVIGSDATGPVLVADLRNAAADLTMLQRVNLPFGYSRDEDSALLWTLIQRDATRMGIGSSSAEVSQAIKDMQISDADLLMLADNSGATTQYVRQVIGDFLTYLRYARLMTGETRLSEAALQRLMHELLSKVQIAAVQVRADRYLDEVEEPTDEQLAALFKAHKGDLPGESEPFGFGYKFPDRVKFEMLVIPSDKLLQRVRADKQVREIDAIEYYEQNKSEFMKDDKPEPYEGKVREQILDGLRQKKASELATRMYQDAQDMLYQEYRPFELVEGYRDVPEDWTPMPLSQVAEKLQERFDILPLVSRHDQEWLDAMDIMSVPYLFGAQTQTDRPYPAMQYLLSARAFKPETANPLAALRLQKKLPSLPLISYDGSLLLVRLLDTSPEHEPTSLDEVRDAVVADAKAEAAYNALLADQAKWETRLADSTPEELAEDLNVSVLRPQPFARLMPDYNRQGGGGLTVPRLPVIGQNEAFVDTVCDLADQYEPGSKPRVVVPVASARSLFLVQITSVQPAQRTEYDAYISYGIAESMADRMLLNSTVDINPLSLDAIKARVRYTATNEDE